MPAIRSRLQEAKLEQQLGKKLQLLQEEELHFKKAPRPATTGHTSDGTNSQSDNNQRGELFEDTTWSQGSTEQQVPVFERASCLIGQSARDQFAAALLRLQANLERSSERLASVEDKLEELLRQRQQQLELQRQRKQEAARGALAGGRLRTILYLGWPVLVFVALRALERRSLANNR